MHFGAGRLGFGLVLPALESSGSPYVIMNRPSKVWHPIIAGGEESQQHVAVKVSERLSRPDRPARLKCLDAEVARAERETHDDAIPPVAPGSRRVRPERFFRPEPKAGVRRRPRGDSAPPRRALPAVWGPAGPYPHEPPAWDIFSPSSSSLLTLSLIHI